MPAVGTLTSVQDGKTCRTFVPRWSRVSIGTPPFSGTPIAAPALRRLARVGHSIGRKKRFPQRTMESLE
jgi:hypothetical protein